MNDCFFCFGCACLLNKPKNKAQAWYKQANMNELFIKPTQVFYKWLSLFTTLAKSRAL